MQIARIKIVESISWIYQWALTARILRAYYNYQFALLYVLFQSSGSLRMLNRYSNIDIAH